MSNRVALVAGGSISTRQADERRNDVANPEGTVPRREMTSSASVQYEVGGFSRVRDRMEAASNPEVAQPRTETQQLADYYYALHKQREAEEKATEQARVRSGKVIYRN